MKLNEVLEIVKPVINNRVSNIDREILSINRQMEQKRDEIEILSDKKTQLIERKKREKRRERIKRINK